MSDTDYHKLHFLSHFGRQTFAGRDVIYLCILRYTNSKVLLLKYYYLQYVSFFAI